MPAPSTDLRAPGLGGSRRLLLDRLKRLGEAGLAELTAGLDLTVETVRSHLEALVAQGLVERAGLERAGVGRPRVRYRLAPAGEALFPDRGGELLRELAAHLLASGRGDLLEQFFAARLERKQAEAQAQVGRLAPAQRLDAVARLLSAEGFLAEVNDDSSQPRLRLHHCPLRELVEVTRLPCRSEMALVGALLGQPLRREGFIPEGAPACTYAVDLPTTPQADTNAPPPARHRRSAARRRQATSD